MQRQSQWSSQTSPRMRSARMLADKRFLLLCAHLDGLTEAVDALRRELAHSNRILERLVDHTALSEDMGRLVQRSSRKESANGL